MRLRLITMLAVVLVLCIIVSSCDITSQTTPAKEAAVDIPQATTIASPDATASPKTTATTSAPAGDNTCNDLLVLVDKTHALPASYVPPDLVPLGSAGIPVASASLQGRRILLADLQRLFRDASSAHINLIVDSPYRSYAEQAALYASYVQQYGQAATDRFSAKAGHSQHQLGTAIDFSTLEIADRLDQSFATTKAGIWMAANAYRYGFSLSYPQGEEAVTGYEFEPWHYRYVGGANALALRQSGLIMQTYLQQFGPLPHC